MRAAGLKAISTVVDSTAILIRSKNPSDPKLVDLIAKRIQGVISEAPAPSCSDVVPNLLQPPKSMSYAHTTSSVANSPRLHQSPLANARPQSTASRIKAGLPSVLWSRGKTLPSSWTSSQKSALPIFLSLRSRTRELYNLWHFLP